MRPNEQLKAPNLIGGEWVEGKDKNFEVHSPYTGELVGQATFPTAQQVADALSLAHEASIEWGAKPIKERTQVMFKFREILLRDIEKIAQVVSVENGKTIGESKAGIMKGVEVLEYALSLQNLDLGGRMEVSRGVQCEYRRIPMGVVASITPFNFPAMVPMWMFPIAIACGNTFILKPSEKDPSCAIKLAELLKEAGLPDGVFNVINGDKESVDAILENKDIKAVSFVGSTPIAKYIYENSAKNEKRVQALGGAKNHLVVMPDCDLDGAVNGLMGAAYGSAGERCMAQSVAVAVGDIGDELVSRLSKKAEALKVGPGMDKTSEMGPLVTKEHLEKVKSYVDLGVEEGAKLVVDGRNLKLQGYENGFYIGGCLFDHVTKDMRVYKEEIFGPVLSVVRVKTFEDAAKLINDHEYGNGVSIYTRDGDAGRTFASKIQVGMVGINVPIPVPMAFHSFGGWKRSLFGDSAMHGMEGIKFYTKLKTVTSRWPSGIRSNAEFVMPTMK